MVGQVEKPGISPDELAAMLGRSSSEGIKCSGGQIENFRRGWAKPIFGNSHVTHYFFREGFDQAVAFCGHRVGVRGLYGPGNYERCARCSKAAIKRGVN